VLVGVFAEGPYTGGSMNPARTLGPAIAFGQFKHVWVYLLATCAGGACAAITYEKLFLEDTQPKEEREEME
jgi:aquaporin NIP